MREGVAPSVWLCPGSPPSPLELHCSWTKCISYAFGVTDVFLKEEGIWEAGVRFIFNKEGQIHLKQRGKEWDSLGTTFTLKIWQRLLRTHYSHSPKWSAGQPPGTSPTKIKTGYERMDLKYCNRVTEAMVLGPVSSWKGPWIQHCVYSSRTCYCL